MTVSCHFVESLGLVGLVQRLFYVCVCVRIKGPVQQQASSFNVDL